jgi:hypothetical protein
MKEKNLYTTDIQQINNRVQQANMTDFFAIPLAQPHLDAAATKKS